MLTTGVNMAGIKQIFEMKNNPAASKDVKQVITDTELRAIVKEEMQLAQRQQRASLRQGDLSRFYR